MHRRAQTCTRLILHKHSPRTRLNATSTPSLPTLLNAGAELFTSSWWTPEPPPCPKTDTHKKNTHPPTHPNTTQVLDSDFFLVNAREAFMENARQFLFETYCRIHQVRCARCAMLRHAAGLGLGLGLLRLRNLLLVRLCVI